MSRCSLKLLCLFVLVSFLSFTTTKAQIPTFLTQYCSTNRTTSNSTFQINVRTLLSSLSSNATASNEFYNATVAGRNSSDTVYGLFMCRGDVPFQLCGQCVINATQKLSSDSNCSLSKQAVIWYDECMVRYSNTSFFSMVNTSPYVGLGNNANVSNLATFVPLMFQTMNETADEAQQVLLLVQRNMPRIMQTFLDFNPFIAGSVHAGLVTRRLQNLS